MNIHAVRLAGQPLATPWSDAFCTLTKPLYWTPKRDIASGRSEIRISLSGTLRSSGPCELEPTSFRDSQAPWAAVALAGRRIRVPAYLAERHWPGWRAGGSSKLSGRGAA